MALIALSLQHKHLLSVLLRLEAANHVRIYVTSKGLLGNKIEAKEFKEGFDDPEVKRRYWSNKLGIKLITERV